MFADVAQKVDVVELVQPIGVVGQNRVRLAGIAAGALEFQEFGKNRTDTREILFDDVVGEDAPALILAGGVADPGGAAAHQCDRLVPGLLQPIQHHDRQQRADMQRGGRAVETDIGRNGPGLGARVQHVRLG